jgi:hypothetical protein
MHPKETVLTELICIGIGTMERVLVNTVMNSSFTKTAVPNGAN